MSDNFLSRWSRRKLEAKEAQASTVVEHAALQPPMPREEPIAVSSPAQAQPIPAKPVDQGEPLPVPTEVDLETVKEGGDIRAFLTDKVSQDLKNKAFKALFSRPEFNVMDGLDIYIDDYNKFTPLTQADIGKMALSKQLLSRPDLEALKEKASDIDQALSAVGSNTQASGENQPKALENATPEEIEAVQFSPDVAPHNEDQPKGSSSSGPGVASQE